MQTDSPAAATVLPPSEPPDAAPAHVSCPVCGGKDWAPHLEAHDFHYGNPGVFAVRQCVRCRLWRLFPMPTAKDLGQFYPEDYYSFQKARVDTSRRRRLASLLGLKRETYLPDSGRPGRMLDVGCGSGAYIAELAARGWHVAGVEPSAAAAAVGRSNGLDITNGSIHDLRFPAEHFDLIRFNHSFEHIPDPVEVLAAARRLLRPGGALFIGVPNTEGLWARLFRSYWWYLGLPVHTYGYNPSNLEKLTRAAGFATEKVRYHSEYAGLLGSLQIWANRRAAPRRSSGRILASWVLRLPALWLCRVLDFARAGDCIEYVGRRN